jgi:predicted Zn-dependent protease
LGALAPWALEGLFVVAVTLGAAGCAAPNRSAKASGRAVPSTMSALAVSDALEARIEEGRATTAEREAAYEAVLGLPTRTAGDAFGRAAVAGRLAEAKGALSMLDDHTPGSLVREAEKYAILSRKLDPQFRDGAATRMLGTLYVLAPANMLEAGDSEEGIELLEALSRDYPDSADHALSLAEAYVALGDDDAARAPLCRAVSGARALARARRALLETLVDDVGELACRATSAPGPTASSVPSKPTTP